MIGGGNQGSASGSAPSSNNPNPSAGPAQPPIAQQQPAGQSNAQGLAA